MQRIKAEFLGGAARRSDIETLDVGEAPRIVFAGRSNVGKSSLLNALTGTKVARVSAEPGKTREMNFYRWGTSRAAKDECILVDLPGYGYAKVPRPLRDQWGNEITNWIMGDEWLRLVVALVDGRHGFMKNDVELIEFLIANHLPHMVAFTKMDKHKSANQKRTAERELSQLAANLGVRDYIFVSALSYDGIKPLEKTLKDTLLSDSEAG